MIVWEDDRSAIAFLRERGYRLLRSYDWLPPEGYKPRRDEISAAYYLFAEWDFGGIVTDRSKLDPALLRPSA